MLNLQPLGSLEYLEVTKISRNVEDQTCGIGATKVSLSFLYSICIDSFVTKIDKGGDCQSIARSNSHALLSQACLSMLVIKTISLDFQSTIAKSRTRIESVVELKNSMAIIIQDEGLLKELVDLHRLKGMWRLELIYHSKVYLLYLLS